MAENWPILKTYCVWKMSRFFHFESTTLFLKVRTFYEPSMLSTNVSEKTEQDEWIYYVWVCENTHSFEWRPSGNKPEAKCGKANLRKSKKRLGVDSIQDKCKFCGARKNLNPSWSKIDTFFTKEAAVEAQNALNGGEEE